MITSTDGTWSYVFDGYGSIDRHLLVEGGAPRIWPTVLVIYWSGTGTICRAHRCFILLGTLNSQLSTSNYSVRHLFTGQQWYSELGLYDLRNRFYSPDIGRFLQPDPRGFNGDATNLYRYCGNNPLKTSDPFGTIAVPNSGGWYTYQANPGMLDMTDYFIYNLNDSWARQCATGAQFMAGGMLNGTYHDMPLASTWYQGASVTSATPPGTVVATGWQGGGYPNMTPSDYASAYPGSPINHVGIFEGFGDDGNMILYDQYSGKPLGIDPAYKDPSQWNEVYVAKDDGPYDPKTSESWPGYSYHSLTNAISWSAPGISEIADYFEGGSTFGGGLSGTNAWGAYTNPMGTMGLTYGSASGGYNVGAGEIINAFTEGGKKPDDL